MAHVPVKIFLIKKTHLHYDTVPWEQDLNIVHSIYWYTLPVAIYDNDSRIRKPLAAFYKSTLENYFLILLYLSQKFSFEMNQIGDNLTLLSRFLFEAWSLRIFQKYTRNSLKLF